MMIVNSSLATLFKDAPAIDADWQEQLYRWLKVIHRDEFPPVFAAQLEMIDCLIKTEQEIQELRKQRSSLKQLIPDYKGKGDLSGIIKTQHQVATQEKRIESLQYRRECILFLGDVMAIKLLDQDPIKHLSANQPSGFISGKSGLKAEIEAAKHFFAQGYMVIFNDLTHSLTMGDLTLRKREEIRTFEVKSNPREYLSPQALRQVANPIVIHQYMKTDITPVPVRIPDENLKDSSFASSQCKAGYAIRLDSTVPDEVHFHDVGKVFKQASRQEVVQLDIGAKHYLAAWKRNLGALRSKLKEMTASGNWIVTNVRRRVEEHRDLPPFGFWFKRQSTIDIVTGEIVIISAFSMEELVGQLEAKGIKLTWKKTDADIFPMCYEPQFPIDSPFELQNKNINQWHWLRVLYSFLALETFVGYCAELYSPEHLAKFAAKVKEIKERKGQAPTAI